MVAEPTVQVLTDGWGEKLLIEAIKIYAGIYHQGPQPGQRNERTLLGRGLGRELEPAGWTADGGMGSGHLVTLACGGAQGPAAYLSRESVCAWEACTAFPVSNLSCPKAERRHGLLGPRFRGPQINDDLIPQGNLHDRVGWGETGVSLFLRLGGEGFLLS